ncbi:hypothetical protein NLX83_14415 [Allokutzneria sp. A3M-2-11 16]|uniref:hypothetical protein n=1 Tax=Allokutzneria sp. A3M-2-11 16 TaxID=2962043 RepID=UPI0020B7578A|nr:hypothetical protein [Allokutzneria sp. A3M-2-11 16]MCP3800456.1 hypothetical protein [Allokutzneria sp. A3M-2-11 16]
MANRFSSTLVALCLATGSALALTTPAEAAPKWDCSWRTPYGDPVNDGNKACIRIHKGNFEAYADIKNVPKGCTNSIFSLNEYSQGSRDEETLHCKKGKTKTLKAAAKGHKNYHSGWMTFYFENYPGRQYGSPSKKA